MFISSFTLINISSLITRSAQLISIIFQHHVSKLSGYFYSNFRRVQVSESYKAYRV
jgi:hypothetical protein